MRRSPTDLTLGIDSGTQSTKVVVCDARGAVVEQAGATHPGGCVQPPQAWWEALASACARLGDEVRSRVRAVAVAGQQHGCVPLGPGPERPVLAPARLWCDTSSAAEADRLNELADFAREVGSRLVASFTLTKLAALPVATGAVCLPHDWLNLQLTGNLATDRGDASGTGWWDPRSGVRRDLLELAGRPDLEVPEILGPEEAAGRLSLSAARILGLAPGIPVGPGTGDNMAAALGVAAREGEIVVSLGTSGTAFAVSATATHDRNGLVAGFADATGRFLPLVCTLNCTVPVSLLASWFGLSLGQALDRAGGPTSITFLPYLRGERTPNLPGASGALIGLTEQTTPDDLLAGAVQGATDGLVQGIQALRTAGLPATGTILLVGGGARHDTWAQALADASEMDVLCPAGSEHAARGAAAQARAVLEGATSRAVAEDWRPGPDRAATPRPGTRPPLAHEALRTLLAPIWIGGERDSL